jgi:hypothetical protein
MATPAEVAESRRADIESEYNGLRDAIEKQYSADIRDRTETYHQDLHDNRIAREQAMVAEGLNPDGSDPQGRQQGSTV